MERIGIYGGTFNPPHVGHIQGAKCAMDALALDRLIFVPDGIAPHKVIPEGSPTPQQRLEMLRIAAQPLENAWVSDVQVRSREACYCCQTVAQVRQVCPDAALFLLLGADMFLKFHDWKNADQILKKADLAVLCRGARGEDRAVAEQKARLEAAGARVHLVENPVVDISSTQLRRMLVFRCADPFLPAGVGDYIRECNLYGTGRDYRNLPMDELEKVVVSLLKPNRVAHVLGCRDTAAKLAKRWGVDETDAARAGLLHDITKALDGPLQLTLCHEYGTILDDFSIQHPKTLHALTGSLVAERVFGENPEVVSAICSHTTGKANMNMLEKIIYVADYMEPNRDFPGVEKLRHLADTDMDAALKCGLETTLEHLARQGSKVSPASREALEYLNQIRS